MPLRPFLILYGTFHERNCVTFHPFASVLVTSYCYILPTLVEYLSGPYMLASLRCMYSSFRPMHIYIIPCCVRRRVAGSEGRTGGRRKARVAEEGADTRRQGTNTAFQGRRHYHLV